MAELPPGFVLDKKTPDLPPGFVLDKERIVNANPMVQETPPATDPLRTPQLMLQAANKGLFADTLGLPVDLASMGLNGASLLANFAAKLFGAQNDITPYVHNPIGGSQQLADMGGAAAEAITGHKLPAPETQGEKFLSNTTELGANAAVTEGLGPLFRMIANLGRAEEVAAPTEAGVQIFRGTDAASMAPTPGSIATAAASGAGAGAVGDVYENYTPDSIKKMPIVGPTLEAAAMLAGAAGGHGLASAAKTAGNVASLPVRAIGDRLFGDERNAAFTLQDKSTATRKDLDVAARLAQDAATDPAKAAANVADTTNILKAQGSVVPTTGAMSADPGLVGLEQKLRMDPSYRPAFIQKDQQVQQAAKDSVLRIAPPDATGRAFTDTANANLASDTAGARGAVDTTQAQIDALEAQRFASAGQVSRAKGTEVAASTALDRNVVEGTLRPMQDASAARYNAVDPARAAIVETDPMIEAAQKVRDTLGAFADPAKILPTGLLRRIERTAGEVVDGVQEPSVTSIGDIVQAYPGLAQTEARARKAGSYTLADNIRELRTSMDGVIEQAAANGDEAAQRAMDAKKGYADTIGATFGGGPGDEAQKFRKDFNVDRFGRSTTPESATADRFLKAGQPEKAASLDRIISASDDPVAGRKAAGDFLAADLAASGAIDSKGRLNPQAIADWKLKWGSTLGMSPEFKKQVDALQSGAAADAQTAKRLEQTLRDNQTALAAIERNDTAFKHVVGSSPPNAVASIFTSADPETAVKEIMAKVGTGTAAHDGLKAAVREFLTEKATTSALQKTSTGENPLSFAKLDTLFKQHESALSQVFSPDEMASLQAAHKFLGSLKNLEQQSLAGSATAERQNALGDKMWRVVEIGLKTLHGGLRGGNEVRNLKLAAALKGGGPDQVAKLLVEMQFNPQLALHLFGRDVPKDGAKAFDKALFNNLVISGALARSSVEKSEQK